MRLTVISSGVVLGLLFLSAATLADAQTYKLTELSAIGGVTSYANSINNTGHVVGASATVNGVTHATLWTNAVASDIGALVGSSSYAMSINNAGEVAGFAMMHSDGPHAIKWSNSNVTDLGRGFASSINSTGQIVGYWSDATLWSGGIASNLGNGIASSINDSGMVVGYSYSGSQSNAIVWSGGVRTYLGKDSAAYAINNLGQVVGESKANNGEWHAALWSGGEKIDLGTLGGMHTVAFDINEMGQSVGYGSGGALLWNGTVQVDLNAAIEGAPGGFFHLSMANGINDRGEIIANGVNANNYSHAFLLTPIPEPETYTIMLLGGLMMSFIARRRRKYEARIC